MTEYRIAIDSRAVDDIEQATAWLCEQAPDKVPQWLESLEAAIASLKTMPERCPFAPENGRWETDMELRQLLFDRYPSIYRIIFTVLANREVRVLQIRHGARRYLFQEN